MIKTNLPVLLIRNMVLFPNSEVRIEIDSEIDKKVISLAEDYYDNQVLIVNPKDVLEQNPDITELPKVGIVGSVKMKIDMPNQNDMSRIIENIRSLISAFYSPNNPPSLPTTMLSYNDINAIEENLYLIKQMLDVMRTSFKKVGTIKSGSRMILPIRR